MNILALAAFYGLAAAATGAPTLAQFEAALQAACPDQRAATRAVACRRADPGSIQFACDYELLGPDGAWARHTALLQLAEDEWVWIDGPTPCDGEDAPDLN